MNDKFEHTSLLSSIPEAVSHQLRLGSTSNGNRLAILGDIDTAELVQVNLNTTGHLAQGGDGSVSAIVSQEGQFLLVGKFHLYKHVSGLLV